jgi:hypothetical protein
LTPPGAATFAAYQNAAEPIRTVSRGRVLSRKRTILTREIGEH